MPKNPPKPAPKPRAAAAAASSSARDLASHPITADVSYFHSLANRNTAQFKRELAELLKGVKVTSEIDALLEFASTEEMFKTAFSDLLNFVNDQSSQSAKRRASEEVLKTIDAAVGARKKGNERQSPQEDIPAEVDHGLNEDLEKLVRQNDELASKIEALERALLKSEQTRLQDAAALHKEQVDRTNRTDTTADLVDEMNRLRRRVVEAAQAERDQTEIVRRHKHEFETKYYENKAELENALRKLAEMEAQLGAAARDAKRERDSLLLQLGVLPAQVEEANKRAADLHGQLLNTTEENNRLRGRLEELRQQATRQGKLQEGSKGLRERLAKLETELALREKTHEEVVRKSKAIEARLRSDTDAEKQRADALAAELQEAAARHDEELARIKAESAAQSGQAIEMAKHKVEEEAARFQAQLTAQERKAKEEAARLQAQLATQNEELERAKQELAGQARLAQEAERAHVAALEAKEKELRGAQEHAKALIGDKATLQRQIQQAQSAREANEASVSALRLELSQRDAALAERDVKLAEGAKQLEEASRLGLDLSRELASVKQMLRDAEGSVQQLARKVEETELRNRELDASSAYVSDQLKAAQSALEAERQKAATLAQQNNHLRVESEKTDSTLLTLQAQVEKQKAELLKNQRAIDAARQREAEFIAALAVEAEKTKALEEAQRVKTTHEAAQRKKIEELETKLRETEASARLAEASHQHTTSTSSAALETERARVRALTEANAESQKALDETSAANNVLTSQLGAATSAAVAQQTEIDKLRRQVVDFDHAQAEREAANQARIRALEEQHRRLAKELQKQKEAAETSAAERTQALERQLEEAISNARRVQAEKEERLKELRVFQVEQLKELREQYEAQLSEQQADSAAVMREQSESVEEARRQLEEKHKAEQEALKAKLEELENAPSRREVENLRKQIKDLELNLAGRDALAAASPRRASAATEAELTKLREENDRLKHRLQNAQYLGAAEARSEFEAEREKLLRQFNKERDQLRREQDEERKHWEELATEQRHSPEQGSSSAATASTPPSDALMSMLLTLSIQVDGLAQDVTDMKKASHQGASAPASVQASTERQMAVPLGGDASLSRSSRPGQSAQSPEALPKKEPPRYQEREEGLVEGLGRISNKVWNPREADEQELRIHVTTMGMLRERLDALRGYTPEELAIRRLVGRLMDDFLLDLISKRSESVGAEEEMSPSHADEEEVDVPPLVPHGNGSAAVDDLVERLKELRRVEEPLPADLEADSQDLERRFAALKRHDHDVAAAAAPLIAPPPPPAPVVAAPARAGFGVLPHVAPPPAAAAAPPPVGGLGGVVARAVSSVASRLFPKKKKELFQRHFHSIKDQVMHGSSRSSNQLDFINHLRKLLAADGLLLDCTQILVGGERMEVDISNIDSLLPKLRSNKGKVLCYEMTLRNAEPGNNKIVHFMKDGHYRGWYRKGDIDFGPKPSLSTMIEGINLVFFMGYKQVNLESISHDVNVRLADESFSLAQIGHVYAEMCGIRTLPKGQFGLTDRSKQQLREELKKIVDEEEDPLRPHI